MKKPIWHSEAKGSAKDLFVAFSAGRDVTVLPEADHLLVPYDIWTNQAHALALAQAGIYTPKELKTILQALARLEEKWSRGEWKLDPALEDVHVNIETYVGETCGEAIGGRLHSGRSRNDQIAADMKLYARDATLRLTEEITVLLSSLTAHARDHLHAVMPGYTHHRKATITTWAHWCAAYGQGLLRDARRFTQAYENLNACPLGSAAAYGTTWAIDRRLVAERLAFDHVQENTLDAVGSRGEAEAEIAYASALLLKRLAGISQDLILFSTEEFGYLSLPAAFTTGSSIMPQKRNPDFAEAIKGKAHTVLGLATALLANNTANLSGYNKDTQWSKYLFFDAIRETTGAAALLADVFRVLQTHPERMEAAAKKGFLNAVDMADHLARSRGIPFRATYRILSDAVGQAREDHFSLEDLNRLLETQGISPLTLKEFHNLSDPRKCIAARDHIGSPHPKRVKTHLAAMEREKARFQRWILKQQKKIQTAKKRCAQATL